MIMHKYTEYYFGRAWWCTCYKDNNIAVMKLTNHSFDSVMAQVAF